MNSNIRSLCFRRMSAADYVHQNHTDDSPFRRSVFLHFKLCIFELFCEVLRNLAWYNDANILSKLRLNVVLM
jgi:hypothetical protein